MALQKKIKQKDKYSKKYLSKIRLRDFLGQLTDEEIQIAKETGLLRWDLWKKAHKVATLTGDLHCQGFELAPVFTGHGEIDKKRYPENVRFFVKDYADLQRKMAKI